MTLQPFPVCVMANERLRALEDVEKEIAMILQCAGNVTRPQQTADCVCAAAIIHQPSPESLNRAAPGSTGPRRQTRLCSSRASGTKLAAETQTHAGETEVIAD